MSGDYLDRRPNLSQPIPIEYWPERQSARNNRLVVGAPKITEDVVSGVHMRLTRVLYVLVQFRIQQRWQPLEDGRWGSVVGRAGAGR